MHPLETCMQPPRESQPTVWKTLGYSDWQQDVLEEWREGDVKVRWKIVAECNFLQGWVWQGLALSGSTLSPRKSIFQLTSICWPKANWPEIFCLKYCLSLSQKSLSALELVSCGVRTLLLHAGPANNASLHQSSSMCTHLCPKEHIELGTCPVHQKQRYIIALFLPCSVPLLFSNQIPCCKVYETSQ